MKAVVVVYLEGTPHAFGTVMGGTRDDRVFVDVRAVSRIMAEATGGRPKVAYVVGNLEENPNGKKSGAFWILRHSGVESIRVIDCFDGNDGDAIIIVVAIPDIPSLGEIGVLAGWTVTGYRVRVLGSAARQVAKLAGSPGIVAVKAILDCDELLWQVSKGESIVGRLAKGQEEQTIRWVRARGWQLA